MTTRPSKRSQSPGLAAVRLDLDGVPRRRSHARSQWRPARDSGVRADGAIDQIVPQATLSHPLFRIPRMVAATGPGRSAPRVPLDVVTDLVGGKPSPSSPAVSRRMSTQRRRDTAPEMRLRRALHAHGERYRLGCAVPGLSRCTIDLAFPRRRVAVFVDGCFWHRCPEHGTSPKANSAWWASKLAANQERDRRVGDALASAGWTSIRVWEHEPTEVATARVLDAVRRSAPPTQRSTMTLGAP